MSCSPRDPATGLFVTLVAANPFASPVAMARQAVRLSATVPESWDDGDELYHDDPPFYCLTDADPEGFARFHVDHDGDFEGLTVADLRKLHAFLGMVLERFEGDVDDLGILKV